MKFSTSYSALRTQCSAAMIRRVVSRAMHEARRSVVIGKYKARVCITKHVTLNTNCRIRQSSFKVLGAMIRVRKTAYQVPNIWFEDLYEDGASVGSHGQLTLRLEFESTVHHAEQTGDMLRDCSACLLRVILFAAWCLAGSTVVEGLGVVSSRPGSAVDKSCSCFVCLCFCVRGVCV